jgi:hypothetical protein
MIEIDRVNGTLLIADQFDLMAATGSISAPPVFKKPGDEYILTFPELGSVECINTFFYDTVGLTANRYLDTFYRVSRDGNAFSEWFPLNRYVTGFPSLDNLTLEVKWVRVGKTKVGQIKILEYRIEGEVERDVVEDDSTAYVMPGKEIVIKAPYIYKVFGLTGYEVITGSDISQADMKWRYSQDNSRTWSRWEPMTQENVRTANISPIRFFQVEFSVHNNGNTPMSIQDINLLGDFQNVSKDYFKSNLMGIRENCTSNTVGAGYYDQSGNFVPYPNPSGAQGSVSTGLSGNSCQTDQNGSTLPSLTEANKAGLYNPYQQNEAQALLNKMSTDAAELFGHKVIYFATDPDSKGTDMSLHEYQLYNVACQGDLKVSVENNNFPDSQIVMNQFDLNLFSTMEVHITKKMFKEVFGPQRRPAKEDFIYFCQLNRMYSVDHAQQFRNFNNSAVYYKLILKKFNMAANVNVEDQSINDTLKKLTNNSALDQLMGIEKEEDKKSIANKPQQRTLTDDPIRHTYSVPIVKELIENSSTVISKSHYDLSVIEFGKSAVEYKNIQPYIPETDNFSYMIWFSINNYVKDDVYGFFSYYDETNLLGWKSELSNDVITVTLNSATYSYYINGLEMPSEDPSALDEDTWYCYVLSVDQRQREMKQWIYKRDVDEEYRAAMLNGTMLRLVHSGTTVIEPIDAYMEDVRCKLVASDMKATNIRLFSDIMPEASHNKLLNQSIVGNDARYLIFADNANTRLSLPRYPMNE